MEQDYKHEISTTIESAWLGHIDFAIWLVKYLNPDTIVDLGVDKGFSTFAWSIPKIGTVYGIDWFHGDKQTGHRDTYQEVNKCLERYSTRYGIRNIKLIRGDFENVSKYWDKPIDILHIDGYHTYEAINQDYHNWKKFLKKDGIILLHDIGVKDKTYGINRFFNELSHPYKLYFIDSYGLGILTENVNLVESIRVNFPWIREGYYIL